MGKMKLYELAKEINISSKDLLEKAKSMGIEVKSHLSTIEESDVAKLKSSITGTNTAKEDNSAKKIEKKPKKENSDKKDNPVIIRREVIIEDESSKEPKQETKKSENKNPFVQRNQKRDYNIVYRDRPQKPMTVSELFGLNKKEEKNQNVKDEASEITTKNQEESKKENMPVNVVSDEVKEEKQAPKLENNSENKNPIPEKNNFSRDNRFGEKDGNFLNRKKDGFRPNNNRDGQNNNFQRRDNRFSNGNDGKNIQNKNANWRNRNDQNQNQNNNNRFNSQNGRNNYSNNSNNNKFGRTRPLDEKRIEKNIKEIMSVDTNMEEKSTREFNRNMDKQKDNNKYDETRNTKKKTSRKNQLDMSINEKKLNTLKQILFSIHDVVIIIFPPHYNSLNYPLFWTFFIFKFFIILFIHDDY